MKRRKHPYIQALYCMALMIAFTGCSRIGEEAGSVTEGNTANRLMLYMEAVEYTAESIWEITDINDNTRSLRNSCTEGRFAIYIDRKHCSSCWKKDIEVLLSLSDVPVCAKSLVIVAKDFESRELKIIHRDTGLEVYDAGTKEIMPYALTQFSLPFFFALSPNGKIILPYYPSNEDNERFFRNYLSLVENRLKHDTKKRETDTGKQQGMLIIKNANLNMGTVKMQRKASGMYEIKNAGRRDVIIRQIYPSCSCVLIDDYPKIIKAGETGIIRFTMVQSTRGQFHHSIQIQTDLDSKPYTMNFYGECQ